MKTRRVPASHFHGAWQQLGLPVAAARRIAQPLLAADPVENGAEYSGPAQIPVALLAGGGRDADPTAPVEARPPGRSVAFGVRSRSCPTTLASDPAAPRGCGAPGWTSYARAEQVAPDRI